ncbi:MAG: tape measure protein [Faecalibacterium sp.]
MSQEVDQRVVEMRFNNANFEKNTKKTISSIDKLMEKLQFKGAEKGFEKLDKAAKDVDLGVIARSVETLEERFSALNVVATAALVNITNRVINAGEKIVKSLTLDGMMKGFGEYETQINSVQTILANTADKGTTLNQVNKALDELNRYADQTIYNFTEMTRNIGTFTAAGVGLNKSVAAIKGIANLGAISGSSSQQVSTAMYQLSQALASGTVKLQDWNSVTNAGMGGRIFQNSLMETARVHGIAIDEMVAKEGSFRETLKNGWLSADILTETLQKFTGDLDREALLAIGYTEEQTEAILKLGETARNAATQVKTLTQLKDTLGEAVQSGWTQTWEIIAGDFEEAKRLYTKISDALGGIIERSAENRNERLSQGLSNGLKQLQNEMGESAELFTYTLENVALAKGLVTEDALLEAGSLGAALEGSQVSADLLRDSIAATVMELNRMQSMGDSELNALGYDRKAVEKQIQAFDKLGQKIEEGTIDLDEFAKKMGQISGRGHLIQSLENVWTAITKITGAVKGAFDEIFPPSSGEQIYTFAQRLDDLTKKLIISDETAEKIKMVFQGVFSVLKVVKNGITDIASALFTLSSATAPLAKTLLDKAADFGDFISKSVLSMRPLINIGDKVQNFVDYIAPKLYAFGSQADLVFASFADGAKNAFNGLDVDKVKEFITGGLGVGLLASVKSFFDGIKATAFGAKDIVDSVKETIVSLGDAVDVWKQTQKSEVFFTIAKSVALIAASLAVLAMMKPERLLAAVGVLGAAVTGVIGILYTFASLSGTVKQLKFTILTIGMMAVSSAVLILASALKVISTIDIDKMLPAVSALGAVLLELSAAATILSRGNNRFIKGSAGLIAFAVGIRVMVPAIETLGSLNVKSLVKGIMALGGVMASITVFAKQVNGAKFGIGKGTGFVLLAASMLILQNAISKFGTMDAAQIGIGLGVIAAVLLEFAVALNVVKRSLGSAVALTILAAAVNMLIPAFYGLGGLQLTAIGKALLTIGGAFAVLGGAAFLLSPLTPVIVALSFSLSALALSLGALMALSSVSAFIGNLASGLSLLQSLDFQVFLDIIKAAAWMIVEFIAGIIKGTAEIASSLVTSISIIISSLCEAIVLSAPAIGDALYILGTVVVDTLIRLTVYVWEKVQPALNDLWGKFTGWVDTKTGELPGLLKEKISGMLQWLNPFAPFMDELKNGDSVMAGLYQMLFQGGKKATEGLAEGVSDQEAAKEAADAAQANAQTVIDTTTKTFDEHSPSKVMYEKGYFAAMGLAEGIADASAADAVRRATSQLAEIVPQQFCKDLDIHSPSWRMRALAMMVPAGMAEGIADGAPLPLAATGRIGQMYERRLVAMESPLYQLGKNVGESGSNGISDGFTNAWNKFKNALGLDENFLSGYDEIRKQVDDALANAGEAPGGQSGGGKGKTAAEAAAEKYTAELKANKAMQDALTKEAALWDLQHGDAAADEELLAKRSETAAEKIELQTERVAIAQAQFDELTKKAGKNDTKTREAYNTLLDEQAELEKLKQSRYEDVWKDLLTRYENETSTAESEYELWATMYQDSATVTEQSNKQMELVNKKIHAQAKVLAVAEKEYTELKEAFGKEHQDTQTAYRKYLQEQTRQQELINELEKAQLDQFDNQIARYEKETRILQNRHQMLDKIYGDGDLSGREDAYKEAVEKYGQGSKEARKAATQGTMSAILGVSKALSSMRYSLKNLTEYQKKYDQVVKDSGENSNAALDALAQLQGEQYNLVGFAENLADAFDMTDMGKKAMMQLGYTISKNWKSIQNGFSRAWKQVEKNMPQTVQNLSMALNLAMSEGAAETAASFIQTIVAAVSGDYATAVVSALNTVLGFMNTEFGKKVMDGLGSLMMDAVNALSKGSGIGKWIKSLFGGGTALAGAAAQTGQIAQNTGAIAGAVGNAAAGAAQIASSGGLFAKIAAGAKGLMGSLAAAAGGIGAKLTTLLGSVAGSLGAAGPVGLAVAALAAGGGLVIANWDKVKEWFGKFGDWMGKTFGKLWEGAKGFVKGAIDVGENILSGLWNGVKSVAGGLWNGIKSIGKGIISGFKNIFGIHSPSTVFAGMGRYMMLGLENGILNEGKGVYQSLEEVSKAALDTAWDCAQRLAKATGESMEYQPTVQPIVDLSRAQAGATWMEENLAGGVRKIGFDLGRTSQLAEMMTRRDMARREAMWQKDQPKPGEMSNKDIIEAIQTLGGRIDGVSEAVGRMKLTLNGKKVVGGIINDVDEGLGKIAQRHKR